MKRNIDKTGFARQLSAVWLATGACLSMAPVAALAAGSDIISVNPHRPNCQQPPPPGQPWPLNTCQESVIQDPRVGFFAVHTSGNNDPGKPNNARCTYQDIVDQADDLAARYQKPAIFDPDGGSAHTLPEDLEMLCGASQIAGCDAKAADLLANPGTYSWASSCPLPSTTSVHYDQYAWALNDLALGSATISAESDFARFTPCQMPNAQCEAKWTNGMMLRAAGFCASKLQGNGLLTLAPTAGGLRPRWNGSAVRLGGFYWTGALTGYSTSPQTPRFTYHGYLGTLMGRGINFTRVWAVEQWTSLQIGTASPRPATAGLTPFGLTSGKYDLKKMSDTFFTQARDFLREAARRGIVVQYTLFDHSGLQNLARGSWPDSPYNPSNQCTANDPPATGCSAIPLAAGPSGKAPADFLGLIGTGCGANCNETCCATGVALNAACLTRLGKAHRFYLEETGKRLGGCSNVIFELMNEPRQDTLDPATCGLGGDDLVSWPPAAVEKWHRWASCVLSGALKSPNEVACPALPSLTTPP